MQASRKKNTNAGNTVPEEKQSFYLRWLPQGSKYRALINYTNL